MCLSAQMDQLQTDTPTPAAPSILLPVAIVLGAAVWPGGEPSPSLRRRALHAAHLWQRGEVGAIIGSGGIGSGGIGQVPPAEAALITRLCLEEGVPQDRLFQEDRSKTTEENLRFSQKLLAQIGAKRVVIVTDLYHAPRARLVARRLGIAAVTSSPALHGTNWRKLIKAGLREIPAYLWYWLSAKGTRGQ